MTPRAWTTERQGLALRVWELGEDGDEVLVCLHGWLDQGLAFANLAHHLGRGRIVAPDQRGHGGSDHASHGAAYHFPNYVADLDHIVRALGDRPIHLLGHSMGGTVAALYAGARPAQVRTLTLVEGMGALESTEHSALARTRAWLEGLREPPRAPAMDSVAAAAERLIRKHPGLDPAHAHLLALHGTVATPDGRFKWSFDPLHLTRTPYPFREDEFLEFLRAITAPTLVVWGSRGWWPEEVRAQRTAALQGAQVVTIDGGHMLPYENPSGLALVLAPHLAAFRA